MSGVAREGPPPEPGAKFSPMVERRYTEAEVEQILAGAAEAEVARGTASGAGMTLAEIQQIAAEAGLNPAAVVTAAAALTRRERVGADPRLLGVRAGVNLSVPLARGVSDAEWQRIVSVARDTFQAAGRQEVGPDRREWRNGNLRVAIESAGESAVLDMRTRRESARAMVRGGLTVLGGSAAVAAALAVAGANPHALTGVLTMAFTGAAMTLAGVLPLPWWAKSRQRQFQGLAEYARALTDGSGEG